MANKEHVKVVRQGAEAIAEWRRANPGVRLDLSEANLREANLSAADLSGSNLYRANLSRANLERANLSGTDLTLAALPEAALTRANVSGANLLVALLAHAKLTRANMSEANFSMSDLFQADLSRGNLSRANFSGASLIGAKLSGAKLTEANLIAANLFKADLSQANLSGANLSAALIVDANLRSADLTKATLEETSLVDVDLSETHGLAALVHDGPSSVSVDTIVASIRGAGNKLTPELLAFFRATGVPAELLEALPGIVAEVKYYSCFIAYGQPDVEFASRLKNDLGAHGVSCWLYAMHATPGKRTWTEIVGKRREADKVVVLCSADALVRDGVLKEIEEQVDEDPDKMVPVSLDDLWKASGFKVMRADRDLKPYLLERNYADFANLQYEEALERLLTGLRREP